MWLGWRKRRRQFCNSHNVELECLLGRPGWVVVRRLGSDGLGELACVSLVLEAEVHFGAAGFPDDRRRVVPGRLLLPREAFEYDLCRPQIGIGLRPRPAGHEMGSRLDLPQQIPRHPGHSCASRIVDPAGTPPRERSSCQMTPLTASRRNLALRIKREHPL
jgi:hypothetical protein